MKNINYIFTAFLFLVFYSCEKEIDIDLPQAEEKLIVEGKIEIDNFPYIILSKSTGYFDPTDEQSVANSYVSDATITISDGTVTNTMTKICSGTLTAIQKDQLSTALGVPRGILDSYNICGFLDLTLVGEVGKTYSISIDYKGEEYTSSTTIPNPVPLDSTWFKVFGDRDSLGFLYANLTEPGATQDQYRWFAKRINKYTRGANYGEVKDNDFLPPTNSVFDDEFVNGTIFEFGYNRPGGSGKDDDFAPERSFYKIGDTVIIKFCSIDKNVFHFISKAEEQMASNGSPFAAPVNIVSNISNGGLGIWAGYGQYYDTIICNK
ncbi:DUF4249 domain-containing protein [Flavobacteriales bacterium]|nr:DUF4249 domain-containing protein [Flavobacteriales bacterium]